MNGELKAILVLVDQPFDLEEVVLLEDADEILDVVPHLGFDLSAAIAQNQRQVRLSILLRLHLLRRHHEAGGNDLVFLPGAVADKKILQ